CQDCWEAYCADKFHDALSTIAQQPVTREWWLERFGSLTVRLGKCDLRFATGVYLITNHSSHSHHVRLHGVTRADVERLVSMIS
ncbi:MAG: hypothetical protein KDA51_04145, partial [Planctomycetales bacterium]|nr:hypothetical protein [Planctomycetales bacterium]